MNIRIFITVLAWSAMLSLPTFSQNITTDTTLTPSQLIQSLVGPGVTISNITYTGSNSARGQFTVTGIPLPVTSGVFMSTGNSLMFDYSSSAFSSFGYDFQGDSALSAAMGVPDSVIFDAAHFEFDMQVAVDTFEMSYFFASEEYNEWVNTNFNDLFAVILDTTNIAFVPGTNFPISIQTINNGMSSGSSSGPCTNCNYYDDNFNAPNFVFDGYTTRLKATQSVVPNQTYHVTLIIADKADSVYDSSVFLQAGSLKASGPYNACSFFEVNINPGDTTICQGSLQLTATATYPNLVYNWSGPGISNPSQSFQNINFAINQQYIVEVVDTTHFCFGKDTVIVSVVNDFSQSLNTCNSAPLNLSMTAGVDSYNWISFTDTSGIVTSLTDITQSIISSEPGLYTGTATVNGCTFTGYFTVIDSCIGLPKVWPGDCNSDLVVSNIDFLYVGLANATTGSGRATVSNAWQPYLSYNWTPVFANGANYKHSDSNGDGTVNLLDTIAISQNYGFIHPLRLSAPTITTTANLSLVANKDTAGVNDWIYVDLVAGSSLQPVDSLYGMAFTFHFEPTLINTTQTSVSYSGSVLGTFNSDLYSFNKYFPLAGNLDAAICRFDQNNATNLNGILGTFTIKTTGTITAPTVLHLDLNNIFAVTSGEDLVLFNVISDSVLIDPAFTGLQHAAIQSNQLSIYPNPATDEIVLSYGGVSREAVIRVIDMHGRVVMLVSPNESERSALQMRIVTGNLAPGMYQVELISGDIVQHGRFMKQ